VKRTVTLGDVTNRARTWNPERAADAEFTYIDLSAIDQENKAIVGARSMVGHEAPSRARQIVAAGDILVSTVRPNLNGVARVPAAFDGATASTGFCVLRPTTAVYGGYLFQWVRSPEFVGDMVRRATGASYPAVSDRIVLDSRMPFPPIEEQRRIAAILDLADTLRAKRGEALALLGDLSQSVFLDMFGDPARNPRGWPYRTFADLCSRVTVGVVVQPASYYVDAGVPALRSLNVKPGHFRLEPLVYFSQEDNCGRLAKSRFRAGDLAIVRSGQPGTAAVIPAELDGVNAIDLIIATPDPAACEPGFLASFMNSKHGKAMVLGAQRGQIQQHLNVGSLNQARVLTPPLEIQREFVSRVAAVEGIKSSSNTHTSLLRDLFISLQDRAFRGDL